jgi:hypothetical protein
MGAHQQIQVRSWAAEHRATTNVPFAWQHDVWYTVKFRVDAQGQQARLRAKVWKRGEPEPEGWTLEAQDPLPIRQGSPGLYGYAPTSIYYDNLRVERNES